MRPIDADKLKETLKDLQSEPTGEKRIDIAFNNGVNQTLHLAMPQIVDDEPTLEVEPVVHAHWIKGRIIYDAQERHCSNCGKLLTSHVNYTLPYCPHCGAKMDEEAE